MNCEKCGQPMNPGSLICESCGHDHTAAAPQVELKKPENVGSGIIGAIAGALLGAASIVLIGQLGYISALSGLILAFCTIKGYELLAKGRSVKGTILCILLIAITPYFADRLNWALVFQQEVYTENTVGEVFAMIPQLVEEYPEVAAEYWKNLAMTYLFAALGAFGILRGMLNKKK